MQIVHLLVDDSHKSIRLTWDGRVSIVDVVDPRTGGIPYVPGMLSSTVLADALAHANASDDVTRLYLLANHATLPNWEIGLQADVLRPSHGQCVIVRNPARAWRRFLPAQQPIPALFTLCTNDVQTTREIETWIKQVEKTNRYLEITILRDPSRRRLFEVLREAEDAKTPYAFWHYSGTSLDEMSLHLGHDHLSLDQLEHLLGALPHLIGMTAQYDDSRVLLTRGIGSALPLLICVAGAGANDTGSAFLRAFYMELSHSLNGALLAGQTDAIQSRAFTGLTDAIECRLQTGDDALLPVSEPVIPLPPVSPVRDLVFISYSHLDQEWCDQLMYYLKPLRHYPVFKTWYDGDIAPGSNWHQEIVDALHRTKVAVLLASGDFLSSDFIMKTELSYFLDARERDECTIIWVAVTAFPYEHTLLKTIEAIHDPTEPLDRLNTSQVQDVLIKITRRVAAALK